MQPMIIPQTICGSYPGGCYTWRYDDTRGTPSDEYCGACSSAGDGAVDLCAVGCAALVAQRADQQRRRNPLFVWAACPGVWARLTGRLGAAPALARIGRRARFTPPPRSVGGCA